MFPGLKKAALALLVGVFLLPSLVSAATFERPLEKGMSGTDVSALQTILKEKGFFNTDITGYYGQVTLQAVADFQKSVGLDSLGYVGPATRALLNGETVDGAATGTVSKSSLLSSLITQLQQLLRNAGYYAVALTGTLDQATLQAAQSISSGTSDAPRRSGGRSSSSNNDEEEVVADTTAPVISGIASSTATTAATISWTTDEASTSHVDYGSTSSYGSASSSSSLSTSHTLSLTGLSPSTTYHFQVRSLDAASNVATSTDLTFTTGTPDVTPPVLSAIASSTQTTAATITWTTNEASDSRIDFGTTTSYGTASTSATMLTSHTLTLTGLTASTTYHFRVQSTDASSNTATSSDLTFRTSSYDLDAFALMERMSVQPDANRKEDINTLVTSLKSAGVWNKLDVLYMLGAHTEQAAFLNWKDSTKNLTKTGTMTFVQNEGMQGDGATGYLAGIGLPTALTQYQQNSAHMGVFVTHAGNQIAHIGRTSGSGEAFIIAGSDGTSISTRLNNAGSSSSFDIQTSLGHSLVVRPDATTLQAYKDGVSLGTSTSPSTVVQASNLTIGRISGTYTSDTIASVSMGSSLTAQEAAALSAALETYLSELGWTPLPEIQTRSLSLQSAVNLPDASGGVTGEGFTSTGLAYDPTDDTWWVGNDGRGLPTDTSFEPSLVHLSSDFSTVIDDFVLSAIAATSTASTSIQGVAYDTSDNTVWFVAVNTASPQSALVYHVTKQGAVIASFPVVTSANGLTYDSMRDQLILGGSTGFSWRDKTTLALLAGTSFRTTGEPDHLFYDAANDYVLYTTGPNGTDGKLNTVDIVTSYGAPVSIKSETLQGADAVEGVSIQNGTLYEVNDGFFHPGNPVKNRALIYSY